MVAASERTGPSVPEPSRCRCADSWRSLHADGTTTGPTFGSSAASAMSVDQGTHLYDLIQAALALRNPLTTTVYPDDKTHKLNVLHAWWPGGIDPPKTRRRPVDAGEINRVSLEVNSSLEH